MLWRPTGTTDLYSMPPSAGLTVHLWQTNDLSRLIIFCHFFAGHVAGYNHSQSDMLMKTGKQYINCKFTKK
jgi:hypothetical protein